jgi:replicative DNA helicase
VSNEKDLAEQHQSGGVGGKLVPITDAARRADDDAKRLLTVRQLLQGAEERAKSERVKVCTFGHAEIDNDTGGVMPGFVWVFGADTSWGKSSLGVMLVDENIKAGKRCLIVSAEDAESLYGDRLMCRRSRVNASRLLLKNLNDYEQAQVARVAAVSEDVPVFLDARGKSAEWAGQQVKKLIRLEKIDLVLYDYLQAFDNQRAQQDRRNSLTYIARVLTDAVKSENIAGVIYSQITVSDAKGGKKHPDKHSIRDSRDVSNAAEVVALGFVPENGIKSKHGGWRVEPGKRAVLLDKVKNGVAKRFYSMKWDDNSACFDAVKDAEQERLEQMADEMARENGTDDEELWDN